MWVKLLQIQWAMQPAETFDWMMAHGVDATLKAYGGNPAEAGAKFRAGVVVTTRWTTELRETFVRHAGHYDFVHGLASAAYTADQALLFVNAGLDPGKPLDVQNDLFWWGTPAFEALAEGYAGFRRVVRGYDAERRGPRLDGPAVSIDAGCGFGGSLLAVCFAADGGIVDQVRI